MTRKNFKYPWHLLDKEGDFFITNAPIEKISNAAAMHFALRRPGEIVRCISRTNDVFVVLVEASPFRTQDHYADAVSKSDIEVQSGSRVVEETIPDLKDLDDDEEDNSFEEVLGQ